MFDEVISGHSRLVALKIIFRQYIWNVWTNKIKSIERVKNEQRVLIYQIESCTFSDSSTAAWLPKFELELASSTLMLFKYYFAV
jgi:hypothetical protein